SPTPPTPEAALALEPVVETLPVRGSQPDLAARALPEPEVVAGAEEDVIVVIEPRTAGVASLPPSEGDAYAAWFGLLGCGGAGGALLWFGIALWRVRSFTRPLHLARPAPEALQIQAVQLAGRIGLRRCPRVYLLPGRLPPLLWWLG